MKKTSISAKHPIFKLDFAELYEFRFVLFMLIVRDIKLRYKQTLLGIAWVVLQPLLTALLFTVIFGRGLGLSHGSIPYVLFAFSGLIPWMVFSGSLQRANTCLINDARLITKVYFPRLFIPLSATFGVIIDYLIALFLGLVLISYFGLPLSRGLLWLPIASIHLFLFSVGVNLIISALNVYYRDLKHVVPFLTQLFMFASPLVYSSSLIPENVRWLYNLNPLVGIIELFRFVLIGAPFPHQAFFTSLATTLLLVGCGTFVFRKMEPTFADII